MKRNTMLKAHISASIIAAVIILAFFSLSLIAEIKGDIQFIKSVKTFILYVLPVILIAMPMLKITGDKLAGKSCNPILLAKKRRMKLMIINGVGLISLAIFLYYRSHFHTIDHIFLTAQIAELGLGLGNLTLIVLNAKSGMQLSGKLQR